MSAPDFDRQAWADAVCADPDLTAAHKLVLLRVVREGMLASGRFSIPRTKLAAALRVDKSRVSEALTRGVDLRLIDRVQEGAPGRTATYQALRQVPGQGARSAPLANRSRGAETLTRRGAGSAPLERPDQASRGAESATPTRARTKTAPADVAQQSPDSCGCQTNVKSKSGYDEEQVPTPVREVADSPSPTPFPLQRFVCVIGSTSVPGCLCSGWVGMRDDDHFDYCPLALVPA